jgi:ABC-2 type transport system ATP-binding protein
VLALGGPAQLKRVHGPDTVISLTADGDLDPLERRAAALDGIRATERVDSKLRVFALRPAGVLAAVVLAASEQGLAVRDATSTPPSLETVFLALTGREYRE